MARHGAAGSGAARCGVVFSFGVSPMNKVGNKISKVTAENISNAAAETINIEEPYVANIRLRGVADLLFHRWNPEAVDLKAAAKKGSEAKKTDNIESYVYRNEKNEICIPGEYVRGAIVMAAKFRQDPRSPRKSAQDLFKAGIVPLDALSSLGVKNWDYLDRRRVVVQRQGINRTRPAMHAGWEANFRMMVTVPEYIDQDLLQEVLSLAGRLGGLADFRPTYGRFSVVSFKTSAA